MWAHFPSTCECYFYCNVTSSPSLEYFGCMLTCRSNGSFHLTHFQPLVYCSLKTWCIPGDTYSKLAGIVFWPGILACLWVPFLSTKCLNEESGFFWNYLLCLHHIALRRGGGDPNQRSRPQESLKSWRFGHYNEDGDERFCKLWMSSSEDSCNLSLAIDPVNWICPILAWRRGFCGATRTCFLRNCA